MGCRRNSQLKEQLLDIDRVPSVAFARSQAAEPKLVGEAPIGAATPRIAPAARRGGSAEPSGGGTRRERRWAAPTPLSRPGCLGGIEYRS